MPVSLIPSFLAFAFIGAITPGPANLCSLSAALHYGWRPALKQWRGLFAGYIMVSMGAVLVTCVLGTVLNDYVGYLSWVGAAYLGWMAWHMLRSAGTPLADTDPAYPSFRTGLLVQLTNVKVMICCLTALTAYVLPYTKSCWYLLGVGMFLPFTGPVVNLIWLFAGVPLQKLFANHGTMVDWVMALSLLACAVSLIWPH